MGWCFKEHFDAVELAKHCKEIGLVAMEGISRDAYPAVRELGLEISLVSGGYGFKNGPCNPDNTDQVIKGLTEAIDVAAEGWFSQRDHLHGDAIRWDGRREGGGALCRDLEEGRAACREEGNDPGAGASQLPG